MGSFSIWHWMVVLLVVLLLFGGGKVSSLMGDFAKGIKSFKKNMAEARRCLDGGERRQADRHDRRPGRTGQRREARAHRGPAERARPTRRCGPWIAGCPQVFVACRHCCVDGRLHQYTVSCGCTTGGATRWSGPRRRSSACGRCGTRGCRPRRSAGGWGCRKTPWSARRIGWTCRRGLRRSGAMVRVAEHPDVSAPRRVAGPTLPPLSSTSPIEWPRRSWAAGHAASWLSCRAQAGPAPPAAPCGAAGAAALWARRHLLLAARRARHRSFRFCDEASEPGKPYCSDHVKLAYVKVRDRREDAA